MIYITKKTDFSAAHTLFNPAFDDAKNAAIYDKCFNPSGHGHNYYMEVTVCGEPDPDTGYLMDLKKLKRIVQEEIIDKVDHKNLNVDVDFLHGIIPTVENLAISFWRVLVDKISPAKLYKIKLHETNTSFVEYYGD